MTLRQKIALVAAAIVLILSAIALIQGEVHSAALGVFVAACALFSNGMLGSTKLLWRRGKG